MKVLAVLILPLLAVAASALKFDYDGFVYWYDEAVPDDFSQLTNLKEVKFYQQKVAYFSPEMLNKMLAVEEFYVSHGYTKRVYVKPTLKHLFVYNSNTDQIDIDPRDDYPTTFFSVTTNDIKAVPKNMERMKLLSYIDLSGNKLEAVDMALFNNFANLNELHLSNNKIKVLSTSAPLNLPHLNHFRVRQNQISTLDVCQWNLPNLNYLYLDENKLSYVVNVLKQFPRLDKISLHRNNLNCDWQAEFEKERTKSNIRIDYDLSSQCDSQQLTIPSKC